MVLTTKVTPERVEIPHEPGEWMAFRPIPVRVTRAAIGELEVQALLAGIAEWSYDAEITAETVDDLDTRTADWAAGEIRRMSHLGADEGEPSAANSNGTTSGTAAIQGS